MFSHFVRDTYAEWKGYYQKSGKLGKTEAITVGVLIGSLLLAPIFPIFGAISALSLVFLGLLFCVGILKGAERLLNAANVGISKLEAPSPRCQCPHCDSTISVKAHICPFCRMNITSVPEEK